MERALDLVVRMKTKTFPTFVASLDFVLRESDLHWPASVDGSRELIALVGGVQEKLELYDGNIYKQDHALLIRDLSSGKLGGFAGCWAWLTNRAYRHTRKAVLALRIAGPTSMASIFTELNEIQDLTVKWAKHSDKKSSPCFVPDFATHKRNSEILFSAVAALDSIIQTKPIVQFTIDELGALLGRLVADSSTPQQIPKLTRLVSEIREKQAPGPLWFKMFQQAWLVSTLDIASQCDPEIRGFKGVTHDRYVDELVHLDEERILLASERVGEHTVCVQSRQ
ncbi:MAG: hypothetical protein NVS1B11_17990 [Terriglobales bacterium]